MLVLNRDLDAAQRFLEEILVTAPASIVVTFGGEYVPVEPVARHAAVARRGLAGALWGLVAAGLLSRTDAIDTVGPLMHGNARGIFRLAEKEKRLPQRRQPPAQPSARW